MVCIQVASTDIEEGMRVGVDRNKYQIHIPLPPKIDPSVTMMQVEEKPDVTYSDVGGCKEQIEKLREVNIIICGNHFMIESVDGLLTVPILCMICILCCNHAQNEGLNKSSECDRKIFYCVKRSPSIGGTRS